MSLWIGNFAASVTLFFCNWIFFPAWIAAGVYFAIKTKFFPLRGWTELIHLFTEWKTSRKSSLPAIALDLSSKIVPRGIWSISAVISFSALSGGYGAVFWMWAFSLLGLSVSFIENLLAQLSRQPDGAGGTAFTVRKFLGSPVAGTVSAVLLLLSLYSIISVQSQEVVQIFSSWIAFQGSKFGPAVLGVVLMGTIACFFFGGRQQILHTVSVLLPLAGLLYLGMGAVILVQNLPHLPAFLADIFADACSPLSASCGAAGFFLLRTARAGTIWVANSPVSGCAAASASVSHPVKQAASQTLGTFCLLSLAGLSTVSILFLSGIPLGEKSIPLKLLQDAAYYQTGRGGSFILTISLSLLSFCSILSSHYAGEVHYSFLFPSQKGIVWFRTISLAAAAVGIFLPDWIPWYLPLIPFSLCFLLNIVALIAGRKSAFSAIENYRLQKKQGGGSAFPEPDVPEEG